MLGIYARISREKEDNKDRSINDQIKLGKEYAKEHKLKYELYIDEGFSGTLDIQERPSLEKLVLDVFANKITRVFAYDQSRLERNNIVWTKLYSFFTEKKVKLHFHTSGDFDFASDNNYLLSNITSIINNYYTRVTSNKIKSVLKRNAREGRAHAIPPYGYSKDENGFLIIDEKESIIIKRIFKMSLSGIGIESIANKFNDECILTAYNKIGEGTYQVKDKFTGKIKNLKKKDSKWRGNTILSIIKNPIYKGILVRSNEEFNHPSLAIFDEHYWEKVNKNLKKNKNNSGKKVNHKYLLRGLIRCGRCQRNYAGRSRVSKKDHYYQCTSKRYKGESCGNRSINIDKIEGIIWGRFFKKGKLLELIKQGFKNEDKKTQEINNLIEINEKKFNDFLKQKNKLIQLASKGIFSDEEIVSQKTKLESSINEVEILLTDYRKQLSNLKNSNKLVNQYRKDFDKYSDNLTFLQKKDIVNEYISDIIVYSFDNNINKYSIVLKFKIGIEDEHYLYFRKKDVLISITNNSLISSSFFNDETNESYLEDKEILENIYVVEGKPYSKPFYIEDNKGYFLNNTVVPHGNCSEWNENKIIDFYKNNPKWLSNDCGLSNLTINKDSKDYINKKNGYLDFKSKGKSIEEWIHFFLESSGLSELFLH